MPTVHRIDASRFRNNAIHFSASAGPLSLLLVPKCPLCLIPILAFFGIAMPPSTGLWIASGVLVAGWFVVLMVAARRHPLILAAGSIGATGSAVAIGMHNRPLLWGAILLMSVAGFALRRVCASSRCSREA